MSPILGIIASQNYPRITTSYESIATVTLSSAQATIEFTSIPSTYKHLEIRYFARGTGDTETANGGMYIKYNGNFITASHRLFGNGSSASVDASSGGLNNTNTLVGYIAGTNATASVFGAGVLTILDYADTNKNKTYRNLCGIDNNGSGNVGIFSGFYNSTSAITSILLGKKDGTGNFAQYSSFALYGIKGA